MGRGEGSVLQGGGLRSLLRFHAAAGARLALRAGTPAVAALVVAVGLAPYPALALQAVMETLAGPPGPLGATAVLASALGLASWAGARAAAGAAGWIAHLPCSTAAHRRALALALCVGQAPLLLLVALSAVALQGPSSAPRLAGTAVAVASCALAVLPLRAHVRGIAGAAACLGAWGTWGTAAVGAALLMAADVGAGPLRPARARRLGRLPLPVPLAIALRAIGRDLPGAWAAGVLPLLAGAAFVRHNVLSPAVAHGATRLAGLLASTLVTASLARSLARHRPPWAWARSLPESGRARVLGDAALLLGACLPAALVAVSLPVLLVLPWLSLRGTAALRGSRPDAAPLLAEGAFVAAWVALLPWLALIPVALTPWALRRAVQAERALSPHAWQEGRHLPGADSLAWDEGGAG